MKSTLKLRPLQGVLNYKRPGNDSKVVWSPPSVLRKIDLILCDEGSQYEDQEWDRFFQCIREQPHKPFTTLVADFQQLQAVVSGGSCERFSRCMDTVELKTVYRTEDAEHLVFLNNIRLVQPRRPELEEYWAGRHWKKSRPLQVCKFFNI